MANDFSLTVIYQRMVVCVKNNAVCVTNLLQKRGPVLIHAEHKILAYSEYLCKFAAILGNKNISYDEVGHGAHIHEISKC